MSEDEKKEYTPPELKVLELEYMSYLLESSPPWDTDWNEND